VPGYCDTSEQPSETGRRGLGRCLATVTMSLS